MDPRSLRSAYSGYSACKPPTRGTDDAAGQGTSVLAVTDHRNPVDEHVYDPARVAMRIIEGRVIRDRRRVEDDDIGEAPRPQPTAVAQAQVLRRQRAEATDGLLQRDESLLPHIAAEQTREASVRAWMRT